MTNQNRLAKVTKYHWTTANLWCAQFFLWATLFSLPFSHFLVNQFVSLSALFVLTSGSYQEKWLRLKQYKSVVWIILFVLIMGLSITYSTAPLSKAFSIFNKYTKLLYILFLLHICQTHKSFQISLNVFLSSITIATILAFLYSIHLADYSFTAQWPKIFAIPGQSGLFVNPINFSVLLAFSIYIVLTRIFQQQLYALSIILLILFSFDLFYFNLERTGCLAALALTYLAIVQYCIKNKIRLIKVTLVITVITVFILFTSHGFSSKLHRLVYEFHRHKEITTTNKILSIHSRPTQPLSSVEDVNASLGSVGLRLEFIEGSLKLIKKRPWLGSGVGSFPIEYNFTGNALLPETTELGDPHNAFLLIGVQIGIIGLLFFAMLLIMLFWDMNRLPFYEKYMGYALGLLFLMNSVFNATLINNTVGYLYVTITAILFSSLPRFKHSV